MFLQVSVCPQQGACMAVGGACMLGACVAAVCVWWGGMCQGHAWQEACMAGCVCGRGCAWQGPCMPGWGCVWQGACMVGGMHGRAVCVAGGVYVAGGMQDMHAAPPADSLL